LFSLQNTLLPDTYMRFIVPAPRAFMLPVCFAGFRTQEALDVFLAKDHVEELPFPGSDAKFDKDKIYALCKERWDEYVRRGEQMYRINAKAFLFFSVWSSEDKNYPDLWTPAMKTLKGEATGKDAIQVGRHLFVELESETQVEDIFNKFVKDKTLRFEFDDEKIHQPFMTKHERKSVSSYSQVRIISCAAVLAVLVYQHLKHFGDLELELIDNDDRQGSSSTKKRKAGDSNDMENQFSLKKHKNSNQELVEDVE
jgi:hypothetical protein